LDLFSGLEDGLAGVEGLPLLGAGFFTGFIGKAPFFS
jgi:hypothetical protein